MDQISTKLTQADINFWNREIYPFYWNKEELPQQRKESIISLVYKKDDKTN
jgi:hypothetical protein